MDKKNRTFGWNELMTSDLDGAKAFYSKVIGWDYHDVKLGDPTQAAEAGDEVYTLWRVGDGDIGGAMKLEGPEMENVPPHWMSYVNVEDIDEVAQRAVSNGGKIVFGPMDVDSIGRFYLIADPQGAVLGLASTFDDETS